MIISGTIIGVALIGILMTSVNACSLSADGSYGRTWTKTVTSCSDNGLGTYNNTLYAETIAWSVDDNGVETFHQGPKTTKYNSAAAESKVTVPYGQGTWFECHWEASCNRCGGSLARDKRMMAF